MNSKLMKWTASNTPGVTVPGKGFAAFTMNVPQIKGHWLVGANIIGASNTTYIAQVVVAGVSRVFNEETQVYVKLYNHFNSALTAVYQLIIWYV